MTPSAQKRLGWRIVIATTAVGILLQATVDALWIYHRRPATKAGGWMAEPIILWPNVVLLLLPMVAGVVLVFMGFYREVQLRQSPDEA